MGLRVVPKTDRSGGLSIIPLMEREDDRQAIEDAVVLMKADEIKRDAMRYRAAKRAAGRIAR